MSDQPSHQGIGPSRKFIPEVKSLESRCLLTTTIPHSDAIVWFPNPPLRGGLAFQRGSVLNCVAGQPGGNTVHVDFFDMKIGPLNAAHVDLCCNGKHFDVEMSWNFGRPHVFTGVTTTIIQAERARTNQFTFQLPPGDTVTAVAAAAGSAFQQPGPSTESTGIELSPHRPADSLNAKPAGLSLAQLHHEHRGLTVETDPELTVGANVKAVNLAKVEFKQDDGFAVQTGSELTVTVFRHTTNIVDFKVDKVVGVEWNGGKVHSFTGVATIVVNTRNATKDQVTLTDSNA
jgi:hypothetical protein